MRFFTYSNLIISVFLISSVKAYDDVYAREANYNDLFTRGEELYAHLQRRYDTLADLSTRELVEELENRLVRRTLSPEEQLAEAKKNGTPLTLTVRPDLVDLEAFRKLAAAIIIPPAGEHHGSAPPSPGKEKPAVVRQSSKDGK